MSPEDAIIRGCGLCNLEVIGLTPAGQPMYEDLPVPVNISIPTGSMVVFRGDYVHGGTSYKKIIPAFSWACIWTGKL